MRLHRSLNAPTEPIDMCIKKDFDPIIATVYALIEIVEKESNNYYQYWIT